MKIEEIEIELQKMKGDNQVIPYLTELGYQIANFENTYSDNEVIFSKPKSENIVYSLKDRKAYVAMPGAGVTLEQAMYTFLKVADEYLEFTPTLEELELAPFLMQLGYGIITGEILLNEGFKVFRGGIKNKKIYHLIKLNKSELITTDKFLMIMDALNPVVYNDENHSVAEFYTADNNLKASALYAAKVISKGTTVDQLIESMKLNDFNVIPNSTFTRKRRKARSVIIEASLSEGIAI